MPITFSSPRAQPEVEVVYCLISNESPYFSNCKSEISASNSLAVFTHAVITGHKFTRCKSDGIKIFSLIHQRVHTSQY